MLFIAILIWVWWWAQHMTYGTCDGGGRAAGGYIVELDLDMSIAPAFGIFEFIGLSAPSLFSAHFLLQTSSSFLQTSSISHQPPCCTGQKPSSWYQLLLPPLSSCLLLLLLRRSMLLWTCCGNSFNLQLLRSCGPAPWGL